MNPGTKKVFVELLLILGGVVIIAIVVFAVWRVRLSNDVKRQLDAIRAAGLPTNGEELNYYYPAVPDSENAALVMTQAFALTRNYSDNRSSEVANFKIPPAGQHLTTDQNQLLSSYVGMNAAALAKMSEAIKLPRSRYPIDFSRGMSAIHIDWRSFRSLAKASEFQALLALEAGCPTNADIPIKNIVKMAETLDEEPLLISYVTRMALIEEATKTLQSRLNRDNLSESELVDLSIIFNGSENSNVLVRAIIGQRALQIPYFLLNVPDIQQITDSTGRRPLLSIRNRIFYRVTGFWERDLRYYLNVIDNKLAIAHSPPPHRGDYLKQQEFAKRHFYIMTALCLPAMPFETPLNLVDQTSAELHSAITALAIEKFRLLHGNLPETLNELVPHFLPTVPVDPFDDQPLRYHRLAEGYVIYSVGPDGHDDGGLEKSADMKPGDKTNYDIIFTVGR